MESALSVPEAFQMQRKPWTTTQEFYVLKPLVSMRALGMCGLF